MQRLGGFLARQGRLLLPGNIPLIESDPLLAGYIAEEAERQRCGLEMIASENFTSRAVMECLGSCLTNKYSEGMPGARYYGGNQIIDKIENLARSRTLEAFGLDPEKWAANVQPYSGSPANFAAYTAFLQPNDRMMGLSLTNGGHLTHGFYKGDKKISATSVYFQSLPYSCREDGYIDYDGLNELAERFRPKLIIAGASAYARQLDFKRFREICDNVGAYLHADIAHIAGLVATKEHPSPFDFEVDLVTTTTHKTLRGPRAGLIITRKYDRADPSKSSGYEEKMDWAVFPGLQGGPHQNAIAGIATQMKEVQSPEFKEYCIQVKKNMKAMADQMLKDGHVLVTGGTDNHLVLWNVKTHGLTGSKMEEVLERCHISVNKNTIPGDTSALNPGGVRIGAPALTTRGLVESDFVQVGKFYTEVTRLAKEVQDRSGKKLKDFIPAMKSCEKLEALSKEISSFAAQFPIPGY